MKLFTIIINAINRLNTLRKNRALAKRRKALEDLIDETDRLGLGY